jgi:S-adenosylmethionine uptake transporter
MMDLPKTNNSTVQGALLALIGFAAFALHDALIKSMVGYSVLQILFFAVLCSYVPFSFFLATDKQAKNLRPVNPGWVLLRTACMVGSAVCAFYAFRTLPLAQTYSLLFAMPMLVTVLAIPMLGERVRLIRWAAIILGLIGVMIVLRPGTTDLNSGHIAALAATLFSALSGVATRKIGASERSATLILYPLLANVLVSGAALGFVYQPMPFTDLLKLAAIGTLAMIGQAFMISAYRAAPAVIVAPFQYSQMLWAVLYGYLWFGETPDEYVLLGTAVIIVAGLMIVWRESSVSVNQPFLQTRNVRVVSAPPMQSTETEQPSPGKPANQPSE